MTKRQEAAVLRVTVIHFWGKDILKRTDECVRVIEETIFDMKISE